MRIKRLELVGCHRLELSGIHSISLDFDQISSILCVIGSNGSGKSSLLSYLSPLPADKNDFAKDGRKTIWLEQNGVSYRLSNDFAEGKHSFVNELTGEELNVGGTLTMQVQLVTDTFRYTKTIHALMTGKDKFTEMSPAKRKEWFTLLCDTDYTYAMKVFLNAKERQRDVQGALKKYKQHQVQLLTGAEQVDVEAINSLIAEKQCYIDELTKAIPYQDIFGDVTYEQDAHQRLKSQRAELLSASKRLHRANRYIEKSGLNDQLVKQLESDLSNYEQMYLKANADYSNAVEQYTALENKLMNLRLDGDSEIQGLTHRKQTLLSELDSLLSHMANDAVNYSEPELMLQKALSQEGTILRILGECGELQTLTFPLTETELSEAKNSLEGFLSQKQVLEVKLGKVNEAIAYQAEMLRRERVECPKCQHAFHPGHDTGKYDKMIAHRDTLLDQKAKCEENVQQLQTKVNDISHGLAVIRKVKNVLLPIPFFVGFAKLIEEEQLYRQGYAVLAVELTRQMDLLTNLVKRKQIQDELNRIDEKIQSITAVDERHYKAIQDELNVASCRAEGLRETCRVAKEKLEQVQKQVRLYKEWENRKEHLSNALSEHQLERENLMKKQMYDLVQERIAFIRQDISGLNKQLVAFLGRSKNIEMVENQIRDCETELKVWDKILQALNPQDGLIAEGLLGYIRIFLSRMNGLIQNIWTYPLIIHPSKVENGEVDLSYRFPITVGHSDKPRADIALGSDGIREVIDLAFKMMAMKALGLEGYPLYLDEFGRTFDAKHSENAVKLIEKLSEEFIEDQIIMVSHSYMAYSVFNDVSFCVLSDDNIVLPPKQLNSGITISRKG